MGISVCVRVWPSLVKNQLINSLAALAWGALANAEMQQPEPDDYVLATGEMHSVREFVELAFAEIGHKINWSGKGAEEVGTDDKTGQAVVRIDPRYYRPTEVDQLLGDPGKANKKLGWRHETDFKTLVKEMVREDLVAVARESRNSRTDA